MPHEPAGIYFRFMEKIIRGIVSGAIATLPMTWTMLRIHREEPREWFKALPPRLITLRLAKRLGFGKHLDADEKAGLVWASHIGYGASMGALFALLSGRRSSRLSGFSGPLFGLAVWAASYMGVMPALKLHRSARRDANSRNRLMVISHLVWGLCMSVAFRCLGRATGSRWA